MSGSAGPEEMLVVGLIFAVIGLLIALLPAEWILKLDRRTGHWLYRQAPDEATGLRRADMFYKGFGMLFVIIGTATVMFALFGP